MKKIISLLLCILMLTLTLAGCGSGSNKLKTQKVPTGITYTLDLSQFPAEKAQQTYGDVTGITEDGLYILHVSRLYRELYGEYILVDWEPDTEPCRSDPLSVSFTEVRPPEKTGYPLTVKADEAYVEVKNAKPVIYLYPTEPTECSVRVDIDGVLTCTYPDHGTDGWQGFTACPDGTLIFPDGQEYYCLYWEGLQRTAPDFTTGFCVRGCDTAAFLADALPKLGLSPREAQEMIIYWLPRMQDNAYNVISFQTTAYTDGARLDVTPAPDTLIRVFMAWYGTDEAVDLPAQTLTAPERTGFTLVEWGGTETN